MQSNIPNTTNVDSNIKSAIIDDEKDNLEEVLINDQFKVKEKHKEKKSKNLEASKAMLETQVNANIKNNIPNTTKNSAISSKKDNKCISF